MTNNLDGLVVTADGRLELAEVETIYGDAGLVNWAGQVNFESEKAYNITGKTRIERLQPLGIGTIASLVVSDIKLDPSNLSIAECTVSGASLIIKRDVNGQLELMSILSLSDETNTFPPPRDILLESISLNNSKIEFVDDSVEPPVNIGLQDITASVQNFSLTDLFSIDLKGKHQAETSLKSEMIAKGALDLKERSGGININITHFELHEIAPYLGNGIKSGRLQLDTDIKMNQGNLIIKNSVHIKNLKIDQDQQSGDQMSLATALFLLKDRKGEVELDVPIETDFDNFEIGFDDIIQTALIRAARTTAVAYAQYALQPYGSLLLAKNLLGAITKPKFEPVIFDPASDELNSITRDYIDKLGALLVSKSDLSVTICGFAGMAELPQLREIEKGNTTVSDMVSAETKVIDDVTLIRSLAKVRSLVVRDLLLESGVSSERLFACTATAETIGGQPRVEISL